MTQWGVDTIFNPAKRHMDEEKRRLQATRAEVGDNSGGRRIDLESGKVRITRGGKSGQQAEEGAEESADEDIDSAADSATAEAAEPTECTESTEDLADVADESADAGD